MNSRRNALSILTGSVLVAAGALAVVPPPAARADSPTAMLPSFAPLVRATKPAVVTIKVTNGEHAARFDPEYIDPRMRDFLERFRGREFRDRRPRRRGRRSRGVGSGFIVKASGIIVTNNHVVRRAREITVVLSTGAKFKAEVIGRDSKTDLALLRIDAGRALPTVTWGNSDKVQIGDWAIAIGNPFGFGGTVTAGIISARGRDIRSGPYDDFLQVDASINRGNSGGPLFNQKGEVIGINTAIYSPSGGNVGIAFAIPANLAKRIVADLIDDGVVERGYLGVGLRPLTREIAESLDIGIAEGALVADVTPGGPAYRAGIRRGDVILGWGKTKIKTPRTLSRIVADTKPGTKATVRFWRRGRTREVTVKTGRFPT